MNKLTVKAGLIVLLATTVLAPLSQVRADVTAPPPNQTTLQQAPVPLESWIPDPILRNFVVEQFKDVFAKYNLDVNNVSKEVFYNTLNQNGESSVLYIGGQNLPLIKNIEGISVFSGIAVNLSSTGGWVSHFTYNPVDWNMLLNTDTNPVTGETVSMASIMDMNIDGRLNPLFPNGVDMSFLYNNFRRIGFDPHNILMNQYTTNLTNENYESFDIKFSDLGLTNLVGMKDTHFVSFTVPVKDGSYISYTGTVGQDSIHFTLDNPIKDYDSQLDGLVISPNDEDVNFPSTPYIQIYFNQYNEDQTKSLNGYINVPINLSYTKKAVPVVSGGLVVNGIDEQGNKIVDSMLVEGNVGDPIDLDDYKHPIDGYTFKEIKDNVNITELTKEQQSVSLVYSKNPVPVTKGTVVVKHIYNSSIQKDTEETLTGNTGSEYKTEARPTGGFHLIKIDGNPTGLFPESDKPITVTYYYSKYDVVPPVKPVDPPIIIVPPVVVQPIVVKPVTIVSPVIPVNLTNYKVVNSSNVNRNNPISKKGVLPVTGDNLVYSLVAVIAGLLLVAGGVVLMLKNKRK